MDSQCQHNLTALFEPAADTFTSPTERWLLYQASRLSALLEMDPDQTRRVADAVDSISRPLDEVPLAFVTAMIGAAIEAEARS